MLDCRPSWVGELTREAREIHNEARHSLALMLAARGLTQKQIAARLGAKRETVRNWLGHFTASGETAASEDDSEDVRPSRELDRIAEEIREQARRDVRGEVATSRQRARGGTGCRPSLAAELTREAREIWNEARHSLAFMLAARGLTQKEIADRLGVSRPTVSTWLANFSASAEPDPGRDEDEGNQSSRELDRIAEEIREQVRPPSRNGWPESPLAVKAAEVVTTSIYLYHPASSTGSRRRSASRPGVTSAERSLCRARALRNRPKRVANLATLSVAPARGGGSFVQSAQIDHSGPPRRARARKAPRRSGASQSRQVGDSSGSRPRARGGTPGLEWPSWPLQSSRARAPARSRTAAQPPAAARRSRATRSVGGLTGGAAPPSRRGRAAAPRRATFAGARPDPRRGW